MSVGLSVLSKNLKTFLRKHKPKRHYHFDPAGIQVDTFQTDPIFIESSPDQFLSTLTEAEADESYLANWNILEERTETYIETFITSANYSEASAIHWVLSHIPPESVLHLSNSMPVRYADLFGVCEGLTCRSNRGTSGIDGCTSTAIGNALVSSKVNMLITGDLAFLYDRNAFFHNYSAPNLKVVIMNNQGGGIFRLIDGPSRQPELETYFETRHNRTAEYICKENNLSYFTAHSMEEIEACWDVFNGPSENASILEVFTDPKTNQEVYKNLRKYIHERTNSLDTSS